MPEDKTDAIVNEAIAAMTPIIKRMADRLREAEAERSKNFLATLSKQLGQLTDEIDDKVSPIPQARPRAVPVAKARAPWGATRAAILAMLTDLSSRGYSEKNGAVLEDFANKARQQGNDVAMSSIRSMVLEMEKAGELRRENGRWFLVQQDSEKGAAVPQPFAGNTADSTSQGAAYADPAAAG